MQATRMQVCLICPAVENKVRFSPFNNKCKKHKRDD